MARAVLVRIFIDKAVGTGRSNGRSQDALALGPGPFTRILARSEGLCRTGSQSCAGGLHHALFAFITFSAASITAAAATAGR
jgi:hypothetical protein